MYCNFGGQWEQRMRNRLVSGLKDDKIRNRLLTEGARLTWEKAIEVTIAAYVQNNYAVTGSSAERNSVHRVNHRQQRQL